MEEFLKKQAKKIDKEIEKFFPRKISSKWVKKYFEKIEFVFDWQTVDSSVVVPVWDFLARGGKRWRPALMLLCCGAVGGKEIDALPFTVIPELAHSGSLVADDIEDNSDIRRGKPALHKLYGLDLAVNVSSLLYFLPMLRLLEKSSLREKQKILLYEVFVAELVKLSFGQAMDIYWHQGKKSVVSEKEYLQMCVYKTGTLARLAAKFGAIIGGGSKTQIDALGDFGSTIGVAFQIRDDILNLSSAKNLGKEFGEDIKEGKRSLLVIHALNNSSKAGVQRLLEILNGHTSDESEIREAISIIEKAGSFGYAKKTAANLVKGSWKKLGKKIPDSHSKKMLREFADFLVERGF